MPGEPPIRSAARLLTRRLLLSAGVVGAGVVGLPGLSKRFRPPLCRRERLGSLTPELIEGVRRNPSAVREAYAACRDELVADLGGGFSDLPDDDLPFIFCTLLANALAPYGESTATTLPVLLAARHLHCGNYPFLLIHLHERLGAAADPPIRLVGWDGGFVGSHRMAYRCHSDSKRCLFLDPTAAVVARATFDEVASGRPIARDRLVCFAYREDEVPNALWVARALAEGRFRPSDLAHYFESMDHQLRRYGNPNDWPTPGAVRRRRATS